MKRLLFVAVSVFLLVCSSLTSVTLYAQLPKKDTVRVKPTLVAALPQADPSSLMPQTTPKSPTVAALGRYGDYPVSLYTGLPAIEIPIHEFKVGTVTVPIKLTYHASGIRVNDVSSWVGLDWSLQTGGMVTRTVQGRPDEDTGNGGVLNQPVPDPTLSSFYDPSCVTDAGTLRAYNLANTIVDGQRDLFAYNTPTGSNTFLLTPGGVKFTLLSPEPVKITPAAGLTSFDLSDAGGTTFRFADTEVTNSNSTSPNAWRTAVSAWHLSEIISLNTTDRALYTYTTATPLPSAPEPFDS